MSQNSFDSLETTLGQLKEIVSNSHTGAMEVSDSVQQMEKLILELKDKATATNVFTESSIVVSTAPAIVLG